MNYYFLVEGSKTEMMFYPKLIKHFKPQYVQIYDYCEYKENNFFMFSGEGNPRIFKKLENSLADIKEINKQAKYTKIKIDVLFLIIDSDKYDSFEGALQSINNYIERCKPLIKQAKVKVIPIIQRECIESWFLGNTILFPKNYSDDFRCFVEHYNVSVDDPEFMPSNSEKTRGQYAYSYLVKMCNESGLIYTKSSIDEVSNDDCIDNIYQRCIKTGQLKTFHNFIYILKRQG